MMFRKFQSIARNAPLLLLVLLAASPIAALHAQDSSAAPTMRILPGITASISKHVHVIPANGRMGVANIGIIVGERALLIVESGLGKANGQIILAEARRIAGDRRIYVIATHAHPEHIGGEQAFPASAVILRPVAQQREIDSVAPAMIEAFRGISPDNKLLLSDFAFRPADVIIDGSARIDLGGVTVDIIDAGPAHTDGDIALLVKEDGVLFTGDVVQQNYTPLLAGQHSSLNSWLGQIDKIEKLDAQILVPSHSAITDRRAFADMRQMVIFLRDRVAAIRGKGVGKAAAIDQLVTDFKAKFPASTNADFLRMSAPLLFVAN